MPNRELREGFLSSEALATLTADEERLYVRLLLCADDFGRFEAKPTLVKSRAFPLADEMAGITVKSVTAWLQALFHKRLIRLYEIEGKSYMQIEKWRQRMRANSSKYPPPPDTHESDAGQPPGITPTTDGHLPDECQTSDGPPQASRARAPVEDRGSRIEDRITRIEERGAVKRAIRSPKRPIPDDFAISDAVRDWFARSEYRDESLEQHFASFSLKARANDYRYANWDSAFMEAVRADWARLRGLRRGNGAQGQLPMMPQRLSAAAQAAAMATAMASAPRRTTSPEPEIIDATANLVRIG